jgi:Mg-chelatase subunit ChlD
MLHPDDAFFKFISVCNASKEVDVIFVVDETGSVELPNFKKTLIALNDTMAILDVGQDRVRVGLMTFNATPTLQFHLDMFDDKEELQNATLSIPYNGGSTSISRAIKYTRIEMLKEERGDRSHAHNRVVLLTDGISSVGGHPTIRKQKDLLEAQRLKDTGAVLICVGIGPEVDPNTLKQMASADDYFIHTTFDLLSGVLKTKINAVVNCKV